MECKVEIGSKAGFRKAQKLTEKSLNRYDIYIDFSILPISIERKSAGFWKGLKLAKLKNFESIR